jgi:putative peptide zinc metalloprotease protein
VTVFLPPLREELVLQEGPRLHDGQPSWTLHDPARNRFFRLDWLTFEIFQRWSLGDPETIASTINEHTPLRPAEEDIMAVLTFAGANQLLSFAGADNSNSLSRQCDRARPSWWQWLVHNYLFFRVPLIKPGAFLEWLHRRMGFLFRAPFWYVTGIAALGGFELIWREWDSFQATWVDFTSLNGFLGYFLVLVGVKIIHEFGHGLVATHFGCHVPTMGVAFLVMTPVAYTDTNEAWNLTDRKSRVWIGAAGMMAELGLAAWATLAWGLLPEGFLRSAAFMVATTTWVKSILVNTSPIMRFDGYYLLSDALDLPNLHSRAFALARWQIREWLFCLADSPPEYFRKNLRRGLVALAIFIWGYRLVVFTGIAIFVYHFFFKALGIVLFTVEISWFIALPIYSEMKIWIQRRRAIFKSPHRWTIILSAAIGTVLVSLPLPQSVRLMGQLCPGQEFKITAPESAQINEIGFRDGEHVRAGQPLVRLESTLLRYRLEKAKVHENNLTEEITSASTNPAMRAHLPVMQTELGAARATRRGMESALSELQPTAPYDGTFRLSDCDLRAGDWVGRQEQVASLISDHGCWAVAYLDEQYVHLVSAGAAANFYFDGIPGRSVKMKVVSVETDATRLLSHPMLTSQFGGKVQARLVEGELIPERAVYRVTLAAEDLPGNLASQIRRGRVVISAGSESIVARWSRNTLSVLWRELGF